MDDYLRCAFAECPAFKKQWDKEPLNSRYFQEEESSQGDFNEKSWNNPIILHKTASMEILHEVVEYYCLEKLSVHLTDYFNDTKFESDQLQKYQRKDIPQVLLNNRFLDLFSRPIRDRSCFTDDFPDENAIVACYGPDAYYQRFELTLPKGSVVKKVDNKISIDTNKLTITLHPSFEGCSTVLPDGFQEDYIGISDIFKTEPYEIRINIEVRINFWSLFSKSGWDYYYWVDSFLDYIEQECSEDIFFKKINWETVYTILEVIQKKKRDDGSKDS